MPPAEPADAELRLFCFPSAGSGAASFRLWPGLLSPAVDVYRIQPPGRETRFRERLLTSMDEYVDSLLPDLLPALGPRFAFFGHSMGSLVSFHVARRLRRDHGLSPAHMIVSAFRSPQAPPMRRIHELADGDFVHELRETYGGIPDRLLDEPEVLSLMLPIIRADLMVAANHRYDAEPPLACPVTAFGGLDDQWVGEHQLAEWSIQTSATFNLVMFPGNHYYLASDPAQVTQTIHAALKAGGSPRRHP